MPQGRQAGEPGGSGRQTHFTTRKFGSISLACSKQRKRQAGGLGLATSASGPCFELGAAATAPQRVPVLKLAAHRPEALLALVPRPLVLFAAGAVSGALAKTITAPLDRVKILLQVKGGLEHGAIGAAAAKGNLLGALAAVGKQEGLAGYWKGNLPQARFDTTPQLTSAADSAHGFLSSLVLRVVPYSAAQLYSYEVFKRLLADEDGKLSVKRRLAAGAAAGMVATLLTHPLDTLRLRIAVDPNVHNISGAVTALLREGQVPALFRGLGASMLGIAPYMGLELASYDLLPREMPSFARGFTAALIATVSCYPLDTIRRHIQLQAGVNVPWGVAAATILAEEGVAGMYRGFLPNALKNLPNKGVKLSVFDCAKAMLANAEKAYEEEAAREGLALAPAQQY